jgi:hypothetical protein
MSDERKAIIERIGMILREEKENPKPTQHSNVPDINYKRFIEPMLDSLRTDIRTERMKREDKEGD